MTRSFILPLPMRFCKKFKSNFFQFEIECDKSIRFVVFLPTFLYQTTSKALYSSLLRYIWRVSSLVDEVQVFVYPCDCLFRIMSNGHIGPKQIVKVTVMLVDKWLKSLASALVDKDAAKHLEFKKIKEFFSTQDETDSSQRKIFFFISFLNYYSNSLNSIFQRRYHC